jgi:nucleoside-diphosphate-sugar epimerase
MKKILVTGGAGFIGLFLSKHLAVDPDTALVLIDNLQRGRMDDDLRIS